MEKTVLRVNKKKGMLQKNETKYILLTLKLYVFISCISYRKYYNS